MKDSLIIKKFIEQSDHLYNLRDPTDYFQLFKKYILKYPRVGNLYSEMGTFLYSRGFVVDALHYFQTSLAISGCSDIRARQSSNNLLNQLLSGWHFPMLNDDKRNSAYAEAIRLMVPWCHPMCILDLGSGTGILSLFCREYGAQNIFACESNPLMLEICDKVLSRLGDDPRIKVIAKRSCDITVGSDIPEPVDLLVIELFDAGFLGEGIVPVLKDFWARLAHQGSRGSGGGRRRCKVIPDHVSLKFALLECQIMPNVRRPHDHDDGHVSPDPQLRMVGTTRPSKRSSLAGDFWEPYHSQKLDHPENDNSGIRSLKESPTLTPFVEITKLYLGSQESISKFLLTSSADPEPLLATVDLEVGRSGYCDTIATSFDLHMLSENFLMENKCTELTLASQRPESCWELAHYTLVDGPVYLERGSNYSIKVFSAETYLIFELYERTSTRSISKSLSPTVGHHISPLTNSALELFPESCIELLVSVFQDLHQNGPTPVPSYIERDILAIVNDSKYWRIFREVLKTYHSNHAIATTSKSFHDCSRGPSLAGLLVSRDSPHRYEVSYRHYPKLTRKCRRDDIISEASVHNLTTPDIVYLGDIVDPKGMIRSQITKDFQDVARIVRPPSSALIIPHSLTLFVRLIESPELYKRTSIVDEGCMEKFGIAQVLNRYRASVFMDLDLGSLPHLSLSRDMPATTINLSDLIEGTSINDVTLGQDFSWDRKITLEVPVRKSGRLTAIAFWFHIHLNAVPGDEEKFTIDTSDPDTHWKQAAVICDVDNSGGGKSMDLLARQTVGLDVTLEGDYIDIRVVSVT